MSTAEKWLNQFKRQLGAMMQKEVGHKLKEYVEEYRHVQKTATESARALADLYQTRINELSLAASLGEYPDLDTLNKLASGIRTVYSLAESASGADVAKKRATQKGPSGGNPDALPALPDLGAVFAHVEGVEVERSVGPGVAINAPINESENENPAQGSESQA